MEKEILREIMKECKWYEKIIVKLFKKLFIRIYNNMRISCINAMLK